MHLYIPWPLLIIIAVGLVVAIVVVTVVIMRLRRQNRSCKAQLRLAQRTAERAVCIAEQFEAQYDEKVVENADLCDELNRLYSQRDQWQSINHAVE